MMKQAMPPAHPGEVLKGLYLEPLEITITQAAENLDVSRRTLSMIVNGKLGISAEMAIRLSKALETPPELWLTMQQNYDLWQAGQNSERLHVKVFQQQVGHSHSIQRL